MAGRPFYPGLPPHYCFFFTIMMDDGCPGLDYRLVGISVSNLYLLIVGKYGRRSDRVVNQRVIKWWLLSLILKGRPPRSVCDETNPSFATWPGVSNGCNRPACMILLLNTLQLRWFDIKSRNLFEKVLLTQHKHKNFVVVKQTTNLAKHSNKANLDV